MLKGNNEIRLNAEVMIAAIQYYFDTVLFQTGTSPCVKSVTGYDSPNASYFTISISEPPPPTPA